jgi:hypothetical protein
MRATGNRHLGDCGTKDQIEWPFSPAAFQQPHQSRMVRKWDVALQQPP